MAMRAPVFDSVVPAQQLGGTSDIAKRTTSHEDDPAWRALMNAPPLRAPLTEDEKHAIDAWKARRAAAKV